MNCALRDAERGRRSSFSILDMRQPKANIRIFRDRSRGSLAERGCADPKSVDPAARIEAARDGRGDRSIERVVVQRTQERDDLSFGIVDIA